MLFTLKGGFMASSTASWWVLPKDPDFYDSWGLVPQPLSEEQAREKVGKKAPAEWLDHRVVVFSSIDGVDKGVYKSADKYYEVQRPSDWQELDVGGYE